MAAARPQEPITQNVSRCASQQNSPYDVRIGSEAEILKRAQRVRFTPESRHEDGHRFMSASGQKRTYDCSGIRVMTDYGTKGGFGSLFRKVNLTAINSTSALLPSSAPVCVLSSESLTRVNRGPWLRCCAVALRPKRLCLSEDGISVLVLVE
jgi:hypothetical protein